MDPATLARHTLEALKRPLTLKEALSSVADVTGDVMSLKGNLQASLRSEVSQQPASSNPAPNGKQTRPLHWSLATGCTPD